jgi:hypothetical protein
MLRRNHEREAVHNDPGKKFFFERMLYNCIKDSCHTHFLQDCDKLDQDSQKGTYMYQNIEKKMLSAWLDTDKLPKNLMPSKLHDWCMDCIEEVINLVEVVYVVHRRRLNTIIKDTAICLYYGLD